MRFEDIHAKNLAATQALLVELGVGPGEVLDRGDGVLDIDGTAVVLHIVERDDDGRVRSVDHTVVTHVERRDIGAERMASYREALA